MPIFEFQCRECDERVEKILRTASEEIPCPYCGQPARRVVSTVSVAGTSGGHSCTAPGGSGFG